MDRIRPLLRTLQKNVDRAAVLVFIILTGMVLFIAMAERATNPGVVTPLDPSKMPGHLPNDEYAQIMEDLSWDGDLFTERPFNEEHPYIDIIRYNIFAPREPPTDQEIIEQVNEAVREATTALNTARELPDDNPRKRDLLERCVKKCDQILTVWAALSGAQQGQAQDMKDEAQDLLNTILGVEEDTEETAGN